VIQKNRIIGYIWFKKSKESILVYLYYNQMKVAVW
jgi:hypothetical protein